MRTYNCKFIFFSGGGSHACRGEVWTSVFSLLREMVSDSAVLVGRLFHHWGAKTESRDIAEQTLFALSNGGTSWPANVVEQSARHKVCGLNSVLRWTDAVFGGWQVQFCWWLWRPATSSWIGCRLQQKGSGGHTGRGSHGRIWVGWKRGTLQHSGYPATVWLKRLGVQPRASSPAVKWTVLGPGVALWPLWGKTRFCVCCREQICRIGPQQWCWGRRTVCRQGLHPGSS